MQPRSALARLQQATTLSLLAAAAAWLAWYWRDSHWVAIAGFLAIAMCYSLVLAMEFVALKFAGSGDSVPQPTWLQLARAWLAETAAAPRVFCWRQPFRWRAIPDMFEAPPGHPARRGVVLIHGFVCNRGFWNPWLRRLRALGHPFVAVNLEPVFGSIDAYGPIIDDAVRRITRATGLAPVLVCHSMGGLAARAWLRASSAYPRVHHVITIGSPHQGTWLAQFSLLENGRQMKLGGSWIRELEQASEPARDRLFTCWYSNCDNIVFPSSTATLPGADNRLVPGVAHVQMAFDAQVMDESLAKVGQ
jgi:triacylglycerol esterase/lipase EstA (alpha/beta hydrolase family)